MHDKASRQMKRANLDGQATQCNLLLETSCGLGDLASLQAPPFFLWLWPHDMSPNPMMPWNSFTSRE